MTVIRSFRAWTLAGVAAVALAACGTAGDVAGIASTPADVEAALQQLGYDSALNPNFTAEGREVAGRTATFTGSRLEINGMPLTTGFTTIEGLGLSADGPYFRRQTDTDNRMEFGDLTVRMAESLLDRPGTKFAAWFGNIAVDPEKTELPLADWTFKTLSGTGLTADVDIGGDQPITASATLGGFALNDMKAGQLATFDFNDFALDFTGKFDETAINGTISVDAITAAKVNLPYWSAYFDGLAALLGAMPKLIAEGTDPADLEVAATGLPVLSSPIDYGMDSGTLTGLVVDVAGVNLTMPEYSFEAIRDRQGRVIRQISPRATMTLTGDASKGPGGAAVGMGLGFLGVQSLSFSGESDYSWNPATDVVSLDKFDFGMDGFFSMSFTGEFGDQSKIYEEIAAAYPDMSGEATLASFSKMPIHSFNFTLRDEAALSKGFGIASGFMGATAEELRTTVADTVRELAGEDGLGAGLGIDTAIADTLIDGIADWIVEGGTLSISLNPAIPFRASAFTDPSQVTADKIGFSVTHTAAAAQ
jgi:hypothetical protein